MVTYKYLKIEPHIMRLSELFYQEEPGGTFTHEGHDYDLNTVLALTANFPIFNVQVSKLAWCLDGVDFSSPDDRQRVEDADLTAPILISPALEGMVPVDGAHRLKKAIDMGLTYIPAKFVTPHLLNQAKLF
jgi:hypothetical protein